jgi:hypothetical protein
LKQLVFDFYRKSYLKPIIEFEQVVIKKLKERMAHAIVKSFEKKEDKINDK